MKKIIVAFAFIIMSTAGFGNGNSWTIEVNPRQIKMYSADKLQRPQWYLETYCIENFANLSFFTGSGKPISPYKDSAKYIPSNKKRWPIFCIKKDYTPFIDYIHDTDSLKAIMDSSLFVASGTPLLIEHRKGMAITKTFFAKRRCQRTVLAIHPNGSVIIYITERATLRECRDYLLTLGCTDALNVDGGSSTFLYINGKKVYSSNEGRSYPNVISW